MTSDEMERAIDFLLKSQANLEQRIEQVNENLGARIEEVAARVEDTSRLLGEMAQTQNQFIQVVTRTFEAQAQINESLRAGVSELAAKQSRTEDALVRLAEAQAHTDRRLDALIDIVQRDRNGQ
jgi:BMFP domain-containing protein YqiC